MSTELPAARFITLQTTVDVPEQDAPDVPVRLRPLGIESVTLTSGAPLGPKLWTSIVYENESPTDAESGPVMLSPTSAVLLSDWIDTDRSGELDGGPLEFWCFGDELGELCGDEDGESVGDADGDVDGEFEGDAAGESVGDEDGDVDGESDGDDDGGADELTSDVVVALAVGVGVGVGVGSV
jgi:hypothetical protein